MKLTKIKKSRMKCSSHELEKYTFCLLVEVYIAPPHQLSHIPDKYLYQYYSPPCLICPATSRQRIIQILSADIPIHYLHTHVHNIAFYPSDENIPDSLVTVGGCMRMRMLLDCINYIVISWSGLDVY